MIKTGKKVVVLFLMAAFLISISGCVAKTEYNKVLEEKAALEKKCGTLSSKETELRDEISDRQKEIKNLRSEIKDLRGEVKETKVEIKDLEKEAVKLEKSGAGSTVE